MKIAPIFLLFVSPLLSFAQDKPNILWITCEDLHPMLGVYGDELVQTPTLDALAAEGQLYENAFATAPVCLPARSAIITGVYATSLGTQNLRSETQVPEHIIGFPKFLREAEYYCTNNAKEDYGFTDPTIWDDSSENGHWRNRPDADQPFFSVFNIGTTHQSRIFGDDAFFKKRFGSLLERIERTNPKDVELFPFYPDTPEIRKYVARYYDLAAMMDIQVSQLLMQLEEDGLTENTIVFFYADHGIGLPRGKRALHDTGMQVPLIIRMPEQYREQYGFEASARIDDMVSLIDMPATVLHLAGLEIPDYMEGESIFADDFEGDRVLFGASDRVDEGFEFSRSARNQEFLYIRNYLPYLPLIQPNHYSDQSEISQALKSALKSAKVTPLQASLIATPRPAEELYDVVNDPLQINNLASKSEYAEQLLEMRWVVQKWQIETCDTGLFPEARVNRISQTQAPYDYMRSDEAPALAPIISLLNRQLAVDTPIRPEFAPVDSHLKKYWYLISLASVDSNELSEHKEHIGKFLNDEAPLVRIEAAKLLIQIGATEHVDVLVEALQSDNPQVLLYAARVYELLGDQVATTRDEVLSITKALIEKTKDQWQGHDLYASWALIEAFKAWGIDLDPKR